MNITRVDFQKEVIKESNNIPVLVDFWAEWCGPCRMLSPLLEKLEKEYNGRFKLVKINTDLEPVIASQFQITGIPHCILFKDGKQVDSFTGAIPEALIKKFLDKHLPNPEKEEILSTLKSSSIEKIKKAIEKVISQKIVDTEIFYYLWVHLSIFVLEKDILQIKNILNFLIEQKSENISSAIALLEYIKKYEKESFFWDYLNKFIKLFDKNKQLEILEYFYKLIEENPDKKNQIKDHLILCFNILGQNHPLSNEYRKKLSRLLF